MGRRGGALAAVAVAAALLLTGCGLLPAPHITSTPTTQGVALDVLPYYGQRLIWQDCGNGFRCTTAKAPLDWRHPAAPPTVRLALTLRPASGTKLGTLFMNPGGPGVAAVAFLKGNATDFFDRALLDSYDLVAWDPRGVGESSAVDCYGTAALDRFLFDDPDLPEGSTALRDRVVGQAKAFGAACERRTGALLAHVGTADTVRDLDMLRAATGNRKLDYFGFSYGTSIGAAYADRFPTRVGRMVLDGAVDPSITAFQQNLANTRAFGDALKTYLADCVRASGCPFRGRTVDEAITEIGSLLIALRRSPIRAADGRPVNSAVLRTAIDAALYNQGSWTYLTRAFTEILRGDPATTQLLADSYVDRNASGYTDNEFEAIYAVNCLDHQVISDPAVLRQWFRFAPDSDGEYSIEVDPRTVSPERVAVLRRQGAAMAAADPLRVADNTEDLGNAVCANWPIPVRSALARVTATGSPPILVLGTTGDPATPYAWAQSLAGQLPKGVLLTLRGQGHTAYRDRVPCINERVDAFYTSGTVPQPVTCG